jgi:hypothetical protein
MASEGLGSARIGSSAARGGLGNFGAASPGQASAAPGRTGANLPQYFDVMDFAVIGLGGL